MGAVLFVGHSPVADFEHVRIVPVAGSGVGIQSRLLVENCQHAVGAATAILPFLLASPSVIDVVGSPPQISADFLAPKPRLSLSPFADAEHNGSPGSIESSADVGVRCLRILRGRAAPVV